MTRRFLLPLFLAIASGLTGCGGTPDNLKFIDTNIYGASVGGGSAVQVGYAGVSYFNVPVVRNHDGVPSVVVATKPGDGRDAFSAYASFGSTAGGQTSCLGRVAAVGHAARIVAGSTAKQC